jgi:mono/diheme cytochrome c family protein
MFRNLLPAAALALAATMSIAHASEPAKPSATYGKTVSILGGCHDCHTADYSEKNGVINPDTALKGNPVGYQGPWGTTYAVNLRLLAKGMTEDAWVKHLKSFTTRPPMPYYNVHTMDDVQLRSLYRYIASLGAPGEPAPAFVPPGQKPASPYIVFAPPVMPAK